MKRPADWDRRLRAVADMAGAVVVATGVVALLDSFTSAAGLGVVYLLAVLFVAIRRGEVRWSSASARQGSRSTASRPTPTRSSPSERRDPGLYDEVVVSTLPTEASRWLQIDLPHRVARIADAPVTHVVAWSKGQAAAVAASRVMSG